MTMHKVSTCMLPSLPEMAPTASRRSHLHCVLWRLQYLLCCPLLVMLLLDIDSKRHVSLLGGRQNSGSSYIFRKHTIRRAYYISGRYPHQDRWVAKSSIILWASYLLKNIKLKWLLSFLRWYTLCPYYHILRQAGSTFLSLLQVTGQQQVSSFSKMISTDPHDADQGQGILLIVF